jgi:hypothetical protein
MSFVGAGGVVGDFLSHCEMFDMKKRKKDNKKIELKQGEKERPGPSKGHRQLPRSFSSGRFKFGVK